MSKSIEESMTNLDRIRRKMEEYSGRREIDNSRLRPVQLRPVSMQLEDIATRAHGETVREEVARALSRAPEQIVEPIEKPKPAPKPKKTKSPRRVAVKSSSRDYRCGNCRQIGHNRSTCKEPPAVPDSDKRQYTCKICGETGHNIRRHTQQEIDAYRASEDAKHADRKVYACSFCGTPGCRKNKHSREEIEAKRAEESARKFEALMQKQRDRRARRKAKAEERARRRAEETNPTT